MRCVWSRPRTGTKHYQSRTSVTKDKRFIIYVNKQTGDPGRQRKLRRTEWWQPLFIFYLLIYLTWLIYIYLLTDKRNIPTKKITARVGKPESELQDPVFVAAIP
jgi:hypothetical protein